MQLLLPSSPFKKQYARRAPWVLGAALGLCLSAAAPAVAQTVTVYGLSATGLVTFDAAAPGTVPTPVAITGVTAGQTLVGLDVRPNTGELFALGYNATTTEAQLYTINPATGVATAVGSAPLALPLGDATARIGFDFNPMVDRIRVVSTTGANIRLNPNNGTLAGTDTNLAYAATPEPNADQTPGVGAAAYTNSYIGAGTTTLYDIDELNNRLVTQNPANGRLQTVGDLGVTTSGATQSADLDIYFNPATRVNQAYLLVNSTIDAANQLYALDLNTGATAAAATIGNGTLGVTDIAVAINRTLPALTGQLVYATQVVGNPAVTKLLSFAASDPSFIRSLTTITGLTAGQALVGIDSRPNTGELFGLGYDASLETSNARLYVINPTTGIATPVGSAPMTLVLGDAAARIGFDFNPMADRIRVVSTNKANYRLHPVTGAVVGTGDKELVFKLNTEQPSVAAAAYTNSFIGTGATNLYVFDDARKQFFLQSPPNDGVLEPVGPATEELTLRAGTSVGFDMQADVAGNNFALLAATPDMSTNTELYDITLGSDVIVRSLGPIGFGLPVTSIAFAIDRTVPATITGQLLYALAGTNLISFDSSNPQLIRTTTPLTGLGANQTLVGLDFRPANGDLYALGYNAVVATEPNAQLYKIDFTTGALTAVGAALRLELGDAAARIGFDFNPFADLIRVVSTNNANLRLNPATGALVNNAADVALNPTGAAISSAAYTNSAPGPKAETTTLFHYDAATNQLFRQDPPNTGVLVAVGSPAGIKVNPTAGVDFDIFFDAAAPEEARNKAYLVAATSRSTSDSLYTINLTTGAATLVGRIGGGTSVSGFSALIAATVLSNNQASAKLSAQVDVFPNPANGTVSISLPTALLKQPVQATLVNTLGQPVLRRTLSARDGSTQRLPLNGLAKGVYILQLSTPEGLITKRLMIQ